jgi:hypothetical protein
VREVARRRTVIFDDGGMVPVLAVVVAHLRGKSAILD